ncbi:MAG: hypothetical protein I4O51_05750 [Flavobacterium micromati]|jgi:hypothetical protein|nr:hypothetical protein [Flavobacterium micromati]
MEPNKLDKHIKEQLNSSEIQPSEMAWSKLDAMLTAAESSNSEQAKQKPKRKFAWMYIAASVVGFLLIGTVYFSQKSNGIDNLNNEVVLENGITTESKKENPEVGKADGQLNEVIGKTDVKGNILVNKTITSREKSIVNKSISNQNPIVEVSINNQKLEKKSIKPQSVAVSVDELLAAVENPSKKEIQSQQNLIVRVNATNLLSEIDGELELSFREKVINKVSKNFQTVKVALSNRNLE